MKVVSFVMPAWMADIQVSGMRPETSDVGLHSSTSCWNDTSKGRCLTDRSSSRLVFSKRTEIGEIGIFFHNVFSAPFAPQPGKFGLIRPLAYPRLDFFSPFSIFPCEALRGASGSA